MRAETALADALGVERWACVVGGSMGGMRALEWAATEPDRVARLFLLASPASASAEQIGWCAPQLAAIRGDLNWRGGDYHDAPPGQGPHVGLGIARRMAHLSYRSPYELAQRFGRLAQPGEDPARGGRYAVESYLDHHADKLVHRFDAALRAAHGDDERPRRRPRPWRRAPGLARVTAETLVAGVSRTGCTRWSSRRSWRRASRAGELQVIDSPYGHDGFLIEAATVSRLLGGLLDTPGRYPDAETSRAVAAVTRS